MIDTNEKDKVVHFPFNKENMERINNPLNQLKNELLNESPMLPEIPSEVFEETSPRFDILEQNSADLGQLDLFNRIQDQIGNLTDQQKYIQYLIDEIDMYLPRKR